jgi:hypothetical protein
LCNRHQVLSCAPSAGVTPSSPWNRAGRALKVQEGAFKSSCPLLPCSTVNCLNKSAQCCLLTSFQTTKQSWVLSYSWMKPIWKVGCAASLQVAADGCRTHQIQQCLCQRLGMLLRYVNTRNCSIDPVQDQRITHLKSSFSPARASLDIIAMEVDAHTAPEAYWCPKTSLQ